MPNRLNYESTFDVLGDILETLRFRGSIFFRSELAAPWGISLENKSTPRFHVIFSGKCFIGMSEYEPVIAEEMDIIMLPHGRSHWIADQPGRELVASERAGDACELGDPFFQQGVITNRIMCGMVQFDLEASHPFISSLPDIILFPIRECDDPIWSLVSLIDAEMKNNHGRKSLIADRLTEALFIKLLHKFINDDTKATGFLAALGDRRMHMALSLIHQEPSHNWTLSSLSSRVGMSKATLVRHFNTTIGMAPMAYVISWRLSKAYNAIKYSSATLENISTSLGFSSARALTRAFEKQFGVTPSKMKKDTGKQ
jgi:AraC-like DNA-binding protein